jgi:uncharacterized protein HemY
MFFKNQFDRCCFCIKIEEPEDRKTEQTDKRAVFGSKHFNKIRNQTCNTVLNEVLNLSAFALQFHKEITGATGP